MDTKKTPVNISRKQLIAIRITLQRDMKKATLPFEKEWSKHADRFVKENLTVKKNKVYELVQNGHNRRGLKRFVVYAFQYMFLKTKRTYEFQIRVGGWWLDEYNTPAKWDHMAVYGVGNPAKFKLSDNQTNKDVPKHLHHLCID